MRVTQELLAVHPRHVDVERDDIGAERDDPVARFERITGFADDLQIGRGLEEPAQDLAERARVVDDQDPHDASPCSVAATQPTSKWTTARASSGPVAGASSGGDSV